MTKNRPAANPPPGAHQTADDALGVQTRAPRIRAADVERERKSLAFAIDAARMLRDDKCENVILLDLRGRSQVTDYFVIASGTSERQMRSAGDHVGDLGAGTGFALFGSNLAERGASWLLLDFVDVVVHLFEPEKRLYYDIEMLWGDAPRVAWERPGDAPPPGRKEPVPGGAPNRNHAGLTGDDVLPPPGGRR